MVVVDRDEQVHSVLAEDLAADLLTVLSLTGEGLESVLEFPLRLVALRCLPQFGPDEGEDVGEKPLRADRPQEVGNDVSAVQRDSVVQWNVLQIINLIL